jgi:hypothetical protein
MPLIPERPVIPADVLERLQHEALELGAWMAREVEDRIKESHLHLQRLADAGLLPDDARQGPRREPEQQPSDR